MEDGFLALRFKPFSKIYLKAVFVLVILGKELMFLVKILSKVLKIHTVSILNLAPMTRVELVPSIFGFQRKRLTLPDMKEI